MDLKIYYDKIRDVEKQILNEIAVVVSNETADGGKAGTKTEVPRRLAARLIVDGLARLATPAEAAAFRTALEEAQKLAEDVAAAARVQIAVLSSADMERLKGASQKKG